MEPVFDFKGRDVINGYDFTNQELCHIMDTAMIYEKRVKSGEAIKDLGSELLAEELDSDALVILTAVPKVYINYNKPDQKALDNLTIEEAKKYMEEGHFASGSMLPKIEAALKFAESKPGRKAIITSLDKAVEALAGNDGTWIG